MWTYLQTHLLTKPANTFAIIKLQFQMQSEKRGSLKS